MSIQGALQSWQTTLPPEVTGLVVGFSGGRDSHVLLHALHQCSALTSHYPLRAIYINHGLRPDAARWGEHCQRVCDALAIPLSLHSLALKPVVGESVENMARIGRYSAFKDALAPNEILLTAHHLEDQAETVLLQLLRGAGPKGLAAMAPLKIFAKGWHGRPLLGIARKCINDYAAMHALAWIEDDSNDDLRFTRNFMRHNITKQLASLNPNYAACLARTAKHCAQTQALLESYLAEDMMRCETSSKGLEVAKLRNYSMPRQIGILRLWLQNQGYPLPSTKKLTEMLLQMTQARADSKPCVEWGQWQAQRLKGEIVIAKREKWTVD